MQHFRAFIAAALIFAPAAAVAQEASLGQTLAARSGISQEEAEAQISAVFQSLAERLKADQPVTVRRFGRFYLAHRDARTARNPRTGEVVQVPPRRYPRFKSSEVLKADLNQG